jgi:formate dehydrogenase major subunit
MFVVEPRRTSTAGLAEGWLRLHVDTDIALPTPSPARSYPPVSSTPPSSNEPRPTSRTSQHRSSNGALDQAEAVAGVPADDIHTLAYTDRAQLCWTVDITEHHNAVDNVVSLINLALFTGHVGRAGSGLSPRRSRGLIASGVILFGVGFRPKGSVLELIGLIALSFALAIVASL